MQAAARQAATCLGQPASGLLQLPSLPAMALQLTSLSSLAGLHRSSWHLPSANATAAATAAAASSRGGSGLLLLSSGALFSSSAASSGGLILPGQLQPHSQQQQQQLLQPMQLHSSMQQQRQQQRQQQQQRPIFNFAGFGGDLSKSHHEKKLLGWTPRQVYDVVAAVEHYHHFVPWCQRSTVLVRQPPGYLEAELEVGFQMFVERYTSKVTLHCPTAVHSRVEDSTLFSHLTNKWEFRLGPTPHTTWLTFEVDFAFKSPLYRQVASVFFEEVVQRMMGAFEGRCAKMYGPSSLHRRPGPAHHVAAGGR